LLRLDTPREGKVRERRPGESTDQLSEPLRTYAEEAKLVMRRPPIVSYTMYALQATEYAQEQGAFEPFHRGVYKAYWEHGKDLGDLDVIGEVSVEYGLDWSELGDRLRSGHYEETVMGPVQGGHGTRHPGQTRVPHRQVPVHRRTSIPRLPAGDGPRAKGGRRFPA